jgi:predicted helicase
MGKMKSIHEVLQDLRDVSLDERDKGTHFESLSKRWLEISPEYSDIFDKVWTYSDWASENDLPKTDVGIDLIARDANTGELCAVQCKFYVPGTSIEKKHIDSFFTALSKKHFSSGLIFSTSTKWSRHAEDALAETTKTVVRVGLHDLEESGVDWDKFSIKSPGKLELLAKKTPFKHQQAAIDDVLREFKTQDRGKMIMACGTGKTFTSLKIAEAMVPDGGTMLFLVPSIALLSQSLKEWKQESDRPLTAYAVCSDSKVGKSKDDEDIQVTDLAYPATTNAKKLVAHFKDSNRGGKGFTVLFSTYQSIDVISKAQATGVPEFDLIICDEAHRTTGKKLSGADETSFVRVHDDKFVKAKKRLYMTATPRIYAEETKQKALESDITLASMDDSNYGPEFHRLNFGKAVSQGLLSDYKVLVLAVSEDHVSHQLQKLLTKDGELNLDDATKIVGCYNGLLKRSSNPDDFIVDTAPMRSAVAFSRSIKDSKRFANLFEIVAAELNENEPTETQLSAEADHVDGTYNMESRLEKLDWLKEETSGGIRILSNARCLSEGVDVPALDAVLFLNPRDSQVDVVQSVGRVMRRSPGKQYGYVILPITVPAGKTAEEALSDNNKYKVVWQVLQALRAHDERFDAMVNKIDLNGDADERLRVIGVGVRDGDENATDKTGKTDSSLTLDFPLGEWKDAILAKIVQKVGQRTYWEDWAKDVASIAENHISRITHLVSKQNDSLDKEFQRFVGGLRDNLNPSISNEDAIEMLAQHLITKPVFDALFEDYAFSDKNPVSKSMQRMILALERASINKEDSSLQGFYESVRARASGITDGAAKQKIVKELYEKFFRLAFRSSTEKLGIVYTPNEIVDFILHSVNDVLKTEFKSGVGERGVHILDPFTGTGTFIVRLLQSGLISREQLEFKYKNELHANEIVLLAYYVAAINIEETFHSLTGTHEPFQGVVLTDSFQMTEGKDALDTRGIFPDNNERVVRQNNLDIRVVIGNPPYSLRQKSENDDNKNMKYVDLDQRILETYAAQSQSVYKSSLYDAYIRSFRWASDRIKERGLIAFVSNAGWLEGKSTSGFRKSLQEEFSSIYVFNLRGDQRTQGEKSKREGGKVFGSGSRQPVSISILVKNPESKNHGQIHYYDIGDYLDTPSKLKIVTDFGSVLNIPTVALTPDEHGDWLTQRTGEFSTFIPLVDSKDTPTAPIFTHGPVGIVTSRDAWAYNFNRSELERNVKRMIQNYNANLESGKPKDFDATKIKWSRGLGGQFDKQKALEFNPDAIRICQYRPFQKQYLYHDKAFNDSPSTQNRVFQKERRNLAIVIGIPSDSYAPGSWITDCALDLNFSRGGSQILPLYTPAEDFSNDQALFAESGDVYAISDEAVRSFKSTLGFEVSKEDIFYYCFGVLSSTEYQEKYQADMTKLKARVPIYKRFKEFSEIGRSLAELQLNYENCKPYSLNVSGPEAAADKVRKLKLVKTENELRVEGDGGLVISGIPLEVQQVTFFGRSPIEWILDRYQVRQDSESGIVNDPNTFSSEGKYVVNLLSSVVSFSLEWLKITKKMPALD